MARRGANTRISTVEDRGGTGPRRWRVKYVLDGDPLARCFATGEEAHAFVRDFERERQTEAGGTVSQGIADYLTAYRARARGQGALTVERLLRYFHDPMADALLASVSPHDCQRAYDRFVSTPRARGGARSAKYHHEALGAARRFWDWAVKRRLRRTNPCADVERVGVENRGKAQLYRGEAIRVATVAAEAAGRGDERGAATLIALELGARAGEILNLTVRDVDGDLLHLDGKTGRRVNRMSPELAAALGRMATGRPAGEPLFGRGRGVNWPARSVRHFCRVVGVPEINCQGARCTHDSLAVEECRGLDLVARGSGHSVEVMRTNYLRPGVVEQVMSDRVLSVLRGGRLGLMDTSVNPSPKGQEETDAKTNGYVVGEGR